MHDSFYQQAGCVAGPTWDVMVPPLDIDRHLEAYVPLSQWRAFETYDSDKECDAEVASLKAVSEEKQERVALVSPVGNSMQEFRVAIAPFAQCVANADPRLKSTAQAGSSSTPSGKAASITP
jgi:hypothetical protein